MYVLVAHRELNSSKSHDQICQKRSAPKCLSCVNVDVNPESAEQKLLIPSGDAWAVGCQSSAAAH